LIVDKISWSLHFAIAQCDDDAKFDTEVRFFTEVHFDSFSKREIRNLTQWEQVSYIGLDSRVKDRRWRERAA
jgi:hypothetical protein